MATRVVSVASLGNETGTNYTVGIEKSIFQWNDEIVTKITIICAVMLCTFIGNVSLIGIICYRKKRRIRRVNVFLVNLAIGDLAVACFTMPMEIVFESLGEWVLGPVVCKLTLYVQAVSLASATFLLTGMSIDRYQVIVRPMKSLAKHPSIGQKVIMAWVMAFIFCIPQLFIFLEVDFITPHGSVLKICKSAGYTAQWQRKVNFVFVTIYAYVIPAVVMIFCYVNIIKVVWTRGSSHKDSKGTTCSPRISVKHNKFTAAKRKAIIMTLTVIIGFLVCLTPYFIISMIRIISDYNIKLKAARFVAQNIFMTHSALNPILYGLFTLKIQHIRSVARVFKCRTNGRGSAQATHLHENSTFSSRYDSVGRGNVRANGTTLTGRTSSASSHSSLNVSVSSQGANHINSVNREKCKVNNKGIKNIRLQGDIKTNGCCGYRYIRKKIDRDDVQYVSSV